jgi:hypothetical protein
MDRPDTAPETVLDAIRRRSDALVTKDTETLLALHHPGFVYVNANGDVLDRDAYLDRYVRPAEVRWISQTVQDARVTEAGTLSDTTVAVVTFLVHDVARAGDYQLDETFRSTQTWVRTEEGWRCLAGHTSQPSLPS